MSRYPIIALGALLLASALCCLFWPALATVSVAALQQPRSDHAHEAGQYQPPSNQLARVLLLRDYNTRVVLLGTVLLGACAGVIGSFMLLRKRSLLGDVVSHAALPGIVGAFLVMEAVRAGSGKWLPGLLAGATLTGLLGILGTSGLRRYTHIKEDAALAIVLSVFFGVGVALLTVVQDIPTATGAGLNSFIYGKAASMIANDVKLIAGVSVLVLLVALAFFKEFTLLCFDERFASSEGWPVSFFDFLLMGLVLIVTVIGLQSVGLLLMVALLIIPPAAARFWTDRLGVLTITAAAIGAVSAYFGVLASALLPRLAAGAIIVLVGSACFGISLLFGTRRGVLRRLVTQLRVRRKVGRQHVLRAFYECLEEQGVVESAELQTRPVPFEQLLARRSWTSARLRKLLRQTRNEELVRVVQDGQFQLTDSGARSAQRIARNHRLWELYLIHYADVAPDHVDRDADEIEHLLEPELLTELERLLSKKYPRMAVPPSPH